MCECGKANEAAKAKSKNPVGTTVQDCGLPARIKIVSVDTTIDAPNNRIYMNDPRHSVVATAVVTWQETTDADGLDSIPKVVFSFTDPGTDNTTKSQSYEFDPGKFLGKRDDPAAVYWEAHDEHAATSPDAWRSTASVTTKPLPGTPKKVIAKIWFKPSGVGGNNYDVKATVYRPDGTTVLVDDTASTATIWRKVAFEKIYEMHGETHVSTNAATTTIAPVFTPAFVDYSAGSRNEIAATHSVKYVGLWKDSATPQQSWATVSTKQPDETPTVQEITEANYNGTNAEALVKQAAARTRIIAKAQKWVNRIDAARTSAMDKWFVDAGIPSNALVGIRYYHPKYSAAGGDTQTNQWTLGEAATPAWLRVNTFSGNYTGIDPDGNWVIGGGSWGGLSHGSGIISVPLGSAAATTKQVVRHEAGHATKSFFKRENFGPSLDHSVSNAGIMYYTTSGGTTFTDREKKILRGIKP